MIYRALLKYGYNKLDILEFCITSILIERENDKICLKVAGSLKGYKHSKTSIELIRATGVNVRILLS
jgi:hypothetical protein